MNDDRSRRELDLVSGAGQVVRATPRHFERGIRRRPLPDFARQPCRGRSNLVAAGLRSVSKHLHFSFDILSGARAAEEKRCAIALRHALHVVDQSGGRADANDQHSAGQGIERASMAGLGRRSKRLTTSTAARELMPGGL